MFGFLHRKQKQTSTAVSGCSNEAQRYLHVPGIEPIDVADILVRSDHLIFADWVRIETLLAPITDARALSDAWATCQLAWLQHMAAGLGSEFHVLSSEDALLLSCLIPRSAKASLDFLNFTRRRIVRSILKGIAQPPARGKNILILFADQETYYHYVSHYYQSEGEFAASSGMHINAGCSHFVMVASAFHMMEPVIAHELVHACVSHLPIPAWLNEGMAVNTESRIVHTHAELGYPQQVHRDLQRYWKADNIQQFWCGASYLQPDEGCGLSYQLGRIMVEQMALDWPRFQKFATHASRADAGQQAAEEYLHASLGAYVCALLDQGYSSEWEPNPASWQQEPERGAF